MCGFLFETTVVEVNGMDVKYRLENTGIYRAPNDVMLAIEISTASTLLMRNLTKRRFIRCDLNFLLDVWEGNVSKRAVFRRFKQLSMG